MELFSNIITVTGDVVQVVLLVLLVLGPLRRYFLIFAYSLAQAFQMAIDGLVLRQFGQSSREYRIAFWTDAIVVDMLLFFLVVALTYRAMEGSPLRRKMTRLLIAVSIIILVLPFVVLSGPVSYTRWLNGTDQILNFGAAIMNLGLWTALIANKKRDPQFLTITAGLGVRVAAVAVTLGLRNFTAQGGYAREIADVAARLSFVGGTLIWCWAFRPRQFRPAPKPVLRPSGG